jgi:hypothetical protein
VATLPAGSEDAMNPDPPTGELSLPDWLFLILLSPILLFLTLGVLTVAFFSRSGLGAMKNAPYETNVDEFQRQMVELHLPKAVSILISLLERLHIVIVA